MINFFVIAFILLLTLPMSASVRKQREIVINLPAFTLYLYENDELIRSYPIGIGRTVKPSLLGETEIINNVHDPTYYPPDWYLRGLVPIPPGPENPVGTRWLGLGFKGYGIHGTNQPWTIGTAASAGCIRLFNEDVEELSRLVGIGTRVTFIYETVDAWTDPITEEPLLRIYPDVYAKEENRVQLVMERLASLGSGEGVDHNFIGALLDESAGEQRSIAYTVPLKLNGHEVTPSAVKYKGKVVVPLTGMAQQLGRIVQSTRSQFGEAMIDGNVIKDSFFAGKQAYAPVHDAMRAFGLLPRSDSDAVAFDTVQLLSHDGQALGIIPFVDDGQLLLPVNDVARLFGVQVAWDESSRAVIVNRQRVPNTRIIAGRAYLPHDTVSRLLGVRIHWFPWQKTARLEMPTVRFRGFAKEEKGFTDGENVFVPVNLVTDLLGMTLSWSELTKTAYIQGKPIPGVSRGGKPYAAVKTLVSVIPSLDFMWDDDVYNLELSIQTGS